MRNGNYITTYTGVHFYILDPHPDEIHIEDIAHALSMLCRANGHFKHFYSVAEHSINCAKEAKARGLSKELQLACLLHDASEAYISDITRPLKEHLPEYRTIEKNLQDAIYKKFEIFLSNYDSVHEIDSTMLHYEFCELMGEQIMDSDPEIKSTYDFSERDRRSVEAEFINMVKNLLSTNRTHTAIGIDGCKYGWVVVMLNSLGEAQVRLVKNIDEVLNIKADICIIDMPIGLTDGGSGDRGCESVARKMLKSRASSVFPVPTRKAVYASSYEVATEINKQLTGKSFSKQSWAIIPKIREVDRFLELNPHMANCFLESHPELCFAKLSSGPCEHYKKDEQGELERISILRKHMVIDKIVNTDTFLKKDVAKDDIIDAAVLAVTGLLGCEYGFKSIPETPSIDSHELKMQMILPNI